MPRPNDGCRMKKGNTTVPMRRAAPEAKWSRQPVTWCKNNEPQREHDADSVVGKPADRALKGFLWRGDELACRTVPAGMWQSQRPSKQ